MSAVLAGEDAVRLAIETSHLFSQQLGLPPEDRARLCIIVEELAANLSDHGALVGGPPHLNLAYEPGCVRLVLTDSGVPFDPRSAPAGPVQRDRGGGAGLAIVRAWAELIDYSSKDGRNRLELLVPLGGA